MRASRAWTALVASVLTASGTLAAAEVVYTEVPLTASDGQMRDLFGIAVAATHDYVAVGAPVDDRWCCRTGFVYVFDRNGWAQAPPITPLDPVWGEFFGFAVAASGDTILVGAWAAAPSDVYRGGAAYVFVRDSTGTWSQQAKLVASDVSSEARFGYSVALDGDTAVVGAYGDAGFAGAGYVFRRTGGVWTQEAKLTASDPKPNGDFGMSVAVQGRTAVIGAPCACETTSGAAYVFERANGSWAQTAELSAADGAPNDGFGSSVALCDDTLVAGSPYLNGNTGAAYAFVRSGMGWVEQARLAWPGSVSDDFYGYRVALLGETAVVAAFPEGGDYGAVYVFGRTEGVWGDPQRLTASDPLPSKFGESLALADRALVVGAYAWPGEGRPNEYTGKAYAFISPPAPSELAADLLRFIDTSVANGTLVGLGPGSSASGRLHALRNMIAASGDRIAEGETTAACQQLLDAYRKVDGMARPPDFATGPAAAEVRARIIELRATLGCS